jgi:16S rRNA G966 N2-methylase RsmD
MSWKQPSNRDSFLTKNLKPIVKEKRVLDFCCGTGMNGIDALHWGASHVTFTDVREQTFRDYTSNKNKNNSHLLTDDNHVWRFLDANTILENITSIAGDVDIIIYHGHFYHAKNHLEIIKAFRQTKARHIIFETKCQDNDNFAVYWHTEKTNSSQWDVWDDKSETALAGSPTTHTCDIFFNDQGYIVADNSKQEWRGHEHAKPQCQYRVYYYLKE